MFLNDNNNLKNEIELLETQLEMEHYINNILLFIHNNVNYNNPTLNENITNEYGKFLSGKVSIGEFKKQLLKNIDDNIKVKGKRKMIIELRSLRSSVLASYNIPISTRISRIGDKFMILSLLWYLATMFIGLGAPYLSGLPYFLMKLLVNEYSLVVSFAGYTLGLLINLFKYLPNNVKSSIDKKENLINFIDDLIIYVKTGNKKNLLKK